MIFLDSCKSPYKWSCSELQRQGQPQTFQVLQWESDMEQQVYQKFVPERSVTPQRCLPVKPASFNEHIQGKLGVSSKFVVAFCTFFFTPVELFSQICGWWGSQLTGFHIIFPLSCRRFVSFLFLPFRLRCPFPVFPSVLFWLLSTAGFLVQGDIAPCGKWMKWFLSFLISCEEKLLITLFLLYLETPWVSWFLWFWRAITCLRTSQRICCSI